MQIVDILLALVATITFGIASPIGSTVEGAAITKRQTQVPLQLCKLLPSILISPFTADSLQSTTVRANPHSPFVAYTS